MFMGAPVEMYISLFIKQPCRHVGGEGFGYEFESSHEFE